MKAAQINTESEAYNTGYRTRTGASEESAYNYAKSSQGFAGPYAEWLELSDDDRAEYEDGAEGIPTASSPAVTQFTEADYKAVDAAFA